jgi:hypothetical protein
LTETYAGPLKLSDYPGKSVLGGGMNTLEVRCFQLLTPKEGLIWQTWRKPQKLLVFYTEASTRQFGDFMKFGRKSLSLSIRRPWLQFIVNGNARIF